MSRFDSGDPEDFPYVHSRGYFYALNATHIRSGKVDDSPFSLAKLERMAKDINIMHEPWINDLATCLTAYLLDHLDEICELLKEKNE